MPDSGYDLFIIHGLVNGAWRVEYRTLGSIHPSIDYPNAAKMLEGIAQTIQPLGTPQTPEDGNGK